MTGEAFALNVHKVQHRLRNDNIGFRSELRERDTTR